MLCSKVDSLRKLGTFRERITIYHSDVHANSYPYCGTRGREVDRTPPHQQDEVYFMGGGAAGGLSRHQQFIAILDYAKN